MTTHVQQGTYTIRHKDFGQLTTGGLATCSALSLTINLTLLIKANSFILYRKQLRL